MTFGRKPPGHSERHDFSQHKRVWGNPINTNDGKQCWHLQRDFTLWRVHKQYDMTQVDRLTKLWHVETAASIVVPCSSQLSNRWSCSDFAMWGGSSHWSTRSCVRALERMKHHETSQFPHLWPQIAQKTPTTHYHSKVCSSLPSKTPLHCHLCPDASPGPVDDTLHGFAHQWHGDSHAARCTG